MPQVFLHQHGTRFCHNKTVACCENRPFVLLNGGETVLKRKVDGVIQGSRGSTGSHSERLIKDMSCQPVDLIQQIEATCSIDL